MKQRIFLNDGPVKNLELVSDDEAMGYITAIDIEVVEKIEIPSDEPYVSVGDLLDQLTSVSNRYERYDSWTTEDESEVQHAFFFQAAKPRTSPVSAGLWASMGDLLSQSEADHWNQWRWTLFNSLEAARETAREHGCREAADKIEECSTLVSAIPAFSEVD
ncbi:hypothetical protein [Crateriforma spongiae]|uniref:hypothetical protein n=1 Tax=Crateriforma spongiae TaxID=2724528 RepID=UPI0039B0B19B